MGLITRLKSLLGLGDERSKTRNRDNGVTIEREPTETRAQPNVESEKAVKMADETPSEDTSVSTEELVDEGKPTDHIEEAEPDTAAEPAEATGPSADASQPAQTEATEPEAEPDEEPEPEAEAPEAEREGEVSEEEPEGEVEAEPEETEVAKEELEAAEEESEAAAEEPEAAEEESTDARPLEDVKGIGPAYAERLQNAGVENTAELAVADPAEIARETDLSTKRIEGWIDRAKSM
ncbi:helix-hairpin-helix domain-containing protein [Haladaptatus sp. W1]|uniref:helix-hairpin-helix domain-containing protein n=1 Tax=Haladaptatus sp. W1 TaxID=1897478 RepID=UPI000B02C0CD|nr:helix-hairpin-helix domain-containing protein [Haladaptatus sp. W1]